MREVILNFCPPLLAFLGLGIAIVGLAGGASGYDWLSFSAGFVVMILGLAIMGALLK